MPNKPPPRRLYWDACVFLSYINEIPDRLPDIESVLAEARRREVQIITSALSIAEVAFAAAEQDAKALDPDILARIEALWAPGAPVQIVEFHQLTAERARGLRRGGIPVGWTGLRSVDAMHLASAQQEAADEFNTYDERLFRYASDIGMPIRPPQPTAPMLGLP